MKKTPAVWFPTVRCHTGSDVFTENLVEGLNKIDIPAEITWLPMRAEYAPWSVPVPAPPKWATAIHVNTWLHHRFIPQSAPVVATIHHAVHHADAFAYKGITRAVYHRYWIAPNERRVLRRADSVIAVSDFVANTARNSLVDVPIKVIYNGIDTRKFQPGRRQRNAREPFRLLYVGSWMARKGVDLLPLIMRELGEGFELQYTGGATAAKDKLDMPKNMHDIGHLQTMDAVAAAMQSADALLFPSRSEGFGLVAAEAMACGVPVIATRCSSLTEVVEDNVTGLLCPLDDVSAFVKAARFLAADASRASIPTQAIRRRAIERFSFDTMLAAYVQVYSSL